MKAERAKYLLRVQLAAQGISFEKSDSILTMLALHDVVLESMPSGNVSVEKMQSILREKGIRIGDDDPVLALLVLNGILLKESVPKLAFLRNPLFHLSAVFLAMAGVLGFVSWLRITNASFHVVLSGVVGAILGAILGAIIYAFVKNEEKRIAEKL